ncbi:11290_t:CDS:2 [Acaulospora morrowiae]|uniref:11290_t:CDS:1 n=1 Tax=Acaulospora morrowiae TaxID=94023 RepID=A0A9N9BRQ6_9GLOM|nr:11290_t:CDS:2 [Acaulospora morrowiae]
MGAIGLIDLSEVAKIRANGFSTLLMVGFELGEFQQDQTDCLKLPRSYVTPRVQFLTSHFQE